RRGRRASGRPVERVVEVWHVDHVVAAELFLGFGERPILNLALTVPQPDGRRAAGELKPCAADHHSGLGQRLGVGPVGAPVSFLSLLVGGVGKVVLVLVDQDRFFHDCPPYPKDGRRRPFSTAALPERCRRPPPTRNTTADGTQTH